MKRHPALRTIWFLVNGLLVVSLLALIYAAMWDYSTREYLRGFSDAVTPAGATPEEKISEILAWMQHGPARRTGDTDPSAVHDPERTLNYQALLRVCGSATNAFVNLANTSGLQSRRLLLLNPNRTAKHVVAEVNVDGRWIVVDPAFRTILRGADGRFLTREDLLDPAVERQATQSIANYNPAYNYTITAHVRLSAIPVIGGSLRRILDHLAPGWENSTIWTLLLERRSFAMLMITLLLVLFLLAARIVLRWHAEARYAIAHVRLRHRIWEAVRVVLGLPANLAARLPGSKAAPSEQDR